MYRKKSSVTPLTITTGTLNVHHPRTTQHPHTYTTHMHTPTHYTYVHMLERKIDGTIEGATGENIE